jgi:hypothetical protein
MSQADSIDGQPQERSRNGPWGHVLVSASACALTVSIVGSAVFLTHRIYTRYQLKGKIREFLAALENRTPQELEERATQIRERPKLVEQMLPELARTLRAARSEEQLCAAIRISGPFLGHKRIRDALFELRSDGRECVAAAAIGALAAIEPPEQAAEVLGRCMEDVPAGVIGPSGLDRLCAGLFQLGRPGLEIMKSHVAKLSVDRRVWLAGFVNHVGGPYRRAWLEMLSADADARVRNAASIALRPSGRDRSVGAPVAGSG